MAEDWSRTTIGMICRFSCIRQKCGRYYTLRSIQGARKYTFIYDGNNGSSTLRESFPLFNTNGSILKQRPLADRVTLYLHKQEEPGAVWSRTGIKCGRCNIRCSISPPSVHFRRFPCYIPQADVYCRSCLFPRDPVKDYLPACHSVSRENNKRCCLSYHTSIPRATNAQKEKKTRESHLL